MTDTAGHPEVAEISDLTEGLLAPSRTADVRQHVNECPLCADVYASLEAIRGMLGTLPGPPRMPDDVAGRIDAALAAEALLNATAPDTETTASDGASHTASSEDDSAHVSRETSPPVDRPVGHPRASTGPGRTSQKRRNRRRTVLGAVFAAAALGLSALVVQSLSDNSSDPRDAAQSPASGTFSGVELEEQVTDLLDAAKAQSTRGGESVGTEGEPDGPGSPAVSPQTVFKTKMPDCIAKGVGDITTAVASKPGTYQGTDAYLVVLRDSSDAPRVTAYVVDASCMNEPSQPAGDVLLKRSYPNS